MLSSRTFATLLITGATLVSMPVRHARADESTDGPARLSLVWSAPKECPSQAEAESRLREKLPRGARAEARARVEKHRARYRLTLEIASRGERVLEADTCDAALSSAAVVLAMSHAEAKESEPPPKEEARPAPVVADSTTATAEPAREAPRPPPRETSRARFGARAFGAVDVGLLPTAALGGGIAFGVDPIERLRLEISGALYGGQDTELASDPSRGARFSLISGTARGCFSLTRTIELSPCLGVELASVSANGFGAAKVATATSSMWGPEAALTVLVPIAGPIALRAGAGAFLPLSRQSFVITAQGTLHRPSGAVVSGFLGPEVRF